LLDGIGRVLMQGIEMFYSWTGNYGIAIIMLTISIRTLLLPLTQSQVRSMKKMRELNPKVEELKKKYKNDQQRLNKETMELYKANKVNPLSGCLPLLLQFPFIIALFRVLQDYPYQGPSNFLWLSNLGLPDPFYILPVLAAATTFWQSKVSSMGGQEGAQQTMLYAMPLLIGWFSTRFAAGLSLYWVVGNLYGVAEQYVIGRKKAD